MSKVRTMLQAGRTFGMRDGLLRLHYEFQRGSGILSRKMQSVQGWSSWNLERIAPDIPVEAFRAARLNGTQRFIFEDPRKLGREIRNVLDSGAQESILAEAERILAGKLPYFGALSYDCGLPPQWFRNPVTTQTVSPRQPWTDMRFASPSYGDLKFILEPSRFLFVYPLLRAYALSGDERFPQAFWRAIEDWAEHSPPMEGPLWICGQECALRIVAWSFALHGFIHSPATTDERAGKLVSMIAANAWRTAQTVDYARSQRSNHLISEAVGLWTAGTLYPELSGANRWQHSGAQLLHHAVLDQFTPEGVSQQHSFNYQRMILHLLLWTLRLAEIYDAPLHPDIRERAAASFDFLRAWPDPASGLVPNYGSDDGSLILPLSSGAYRDYRPLLQLGSAILQRPALPSGPWNEALLWFGIKPAEAFRPAAFSKPPTNETGYFRVGDAASWALIRAARYTRRPFQADQLHADLWWNGINLARDAGTYLYNGPPPWSNAFARTAIHNTITVDHQDQMRRAGRFLWVDWAQASGNLSSCNGNACPDRFQGEHDGYRRLGVTHRRTVQWLKDSGWVIIDDLEGTGQHDLCLHWLTADFPFEISDAPFQVLLKAAHSRLTWNVFSSAPGNPAVIRAGNPLHGKIVEHPNMHLLGWEAATYSDLRPAISILYQTRSLLPVRFVTVLRAEERCSLELQGGDVLVLRDDSATVNSNGQEFNQGEIYRVNLAPGSQPKITPQQH
jgi:hypothetical protein